MPALGRGAVLLGFLLFSVAASAQAQSPPKESMATGSVAGRVTVDGSAKSGVEIAAYPQGPTSRSLVEPWASATTDEDGRFLLTGLEEGRYWVAPRSRIYISAGRARSWNSPSGKVLILAEGEAVKGIDFALVTGGFITGRVTDAQGQQVSGEFVTLTQSPASVW